MQARGYNQSTLAQEAERRGHVLRQSYISQIIRGEILEPRDDKIAIFKELLGLTKRDFYEARGALEGIDAEAAPRQLALLSLRGDEEYTAEEIVAHVESRPGRQFQEDLRQAREERAYAEYVEFCLDIFRAWESNSDLGVKSLRRSRTLSTDGR